MKKKTINAIISKKIKDWLSSIDDETLVMDIKQNLIVTGGCITSMLLNEDVNDFDIYFTNKQTVKNVAEYYTRVFNENNKNRTNKIGNALVSWVLDGKDLQDWKEDKIKLSSFAKGYRDIPYSDIKGWNEDDFEANSEYRKYLNISGMLLNTPEDRIKIIVNSDGVAEDSDNKADEVDYSIDEYLDAVSDADDISAEKIEEKPYKPVFLSTNAITLSNKIQLIIRFYGTAEEIHKNYDFVHVLNYWTPSTGVVLKQEALEAMMNKELVYVGSKYPIASLIRTRKFIKRGWQINAGQYLKMAFQVSELDLKNIYVLEDQLVGVDSIYFLNFIQELKTKIEKDKNYTFDSNYVVTVIDKVFG